MTRRTELACAALLIGVVLVPTAERQQPIYESEAKTVTATIEAVDKASRDRKSVV